MPKDKEARNRQLRLLVFTVVAVILFNVIAHNFAFASFRFSTIQVMMLTLGVFTLAIALVMWQIVNPLVKIASEASRALQGKNYHKVSFRDHINELDDINEFLGCVVACTNKIKSRKKHSKRK